MVRLRMSTGTGVRMPVKGGLGVGIIIVLLAVFMLATGNQKYLWILGIAAAIFIISIIARRKLPDGEGGFGRIRFGRRRRY